MEGKRVVIIGSGLGGLMCGAILAREGYDVHVLEKNRQLGGSLQIFARNKCIFDTGVHYIGGLGPGENLHHFFSFVGIMDKLKVSKLDPNRFDVIGFDNDSNSYPMAQGYDAFLKNLVNHFPEEKDNIERYVQTIQKVCNDFPLYNLRKGAEEIDSPYVVQSLKEFIEGITPNKKLQNVLIGNNMLYAGDPAKTPLHVHALVTNSYIQSAWRCVGGGSQIANELGKMIKLHGGKLKKRAAVVKIETEQDTVNHVVLDTGEKIEGDIFISNIHPVPTFEMLSAKSIRPAFRQRLALMENSISTFIVNIVLEPGTVPYFNHNLYIHSCDNLWENLDHTDDTWPKSFAIFCAESHKHTGFCESITLMAYMRYDEVAQWSHTFNTAENPSERGGEYESFKSKKSEILIESLEKRMPGVRNFIKSHYSATPLTYRDYIGTTDGSIYGITKDYRDPLKTFISPRTKLSNLFLTGQNVHMHGVLGVTVSSLLTCSQILGHDYLMDKLLKNT